ncbi:hypothetical protein [uncultured Modestobacter sp.]|uniref:hypothetical protein n=1 Tax=uncultured Modestobacter sp. TaxID=380048 RepID=UPI0026343AC6|nr:hypothetical protein [uncultured Modestobacter sp.]
MPAGPRVRRGIGLLVLGIGLHVLYLVLRTAEIGKIGAPADIGGGLIPLAGYAFAVIGVGLLIQGWRDDRSGE